MIRQKEKSRSESLRERAELVIERFELLEPQATAELSVRKIDQKPVAAITPAPMSRTMLGPGDTLTSRAALKTLLGAGWSKGSDAVLWSDGSRAMIHFVVDAREASSVIVELDLLGFLGAQCITSVSIYFGDRMLVEALFDNARHRQVVRCEVPHGQGGEHMAIQLDLAIHHLTSPAALGVGEDARKLGVALQRLCLLQG